VRCVFPILGVVLAAQTVLAQDEAKPKVIAPWQTPCGEELVKANFELRNKEYVSGKLTDPAGAPLKDSKVVLRKLNDKGEFADYRVALTNSDGHFELKLVEPGKYRFLPGPNRGWTQPKSISCNHESKGSDCELNLVVALNATDQPFAGCPIR
jgi:hypothetical protein